MCRILSKGRSFLIDILTEIEQNLVKSGSLFEAEQIILRHEPEEGYQNGSWLTEDDYRHIYVIYTLAVHPDFLKCGVGTELLAFAEQTARKEGCVSIRLDVVKGNIPAERLYQRCGYQLTGTVSLGYEEYGLPWFHLYEKIL